MAVRNELRISSVDARTGRAVAEHYIASGRGWNCSDGYVRSEGSLRTDPRIRVSVRTPSASSGADRYADGERTKGRGGAGQAMSWIEDPDVSTVAVVHTKEKHRSEKRVHDLVRDA